MSERFNIQKELGRGGMGKVYQAWDTKLQRMVAIKSLITDKETSADLLAEAALTASLHHPYIVGVFDIENDETDGSMSIIMEFLNGETLEDIASKNALTYHDFVLIADNALEGLSIAHHIGLVHRDIKPSNIMTHFLQDGSLQAKVLDFGLGKVAHRPAKQTLLHNGSIYGSIYCMSPEQLCHEALDHRTDLYSMGCVFYYALAGRYPHTGQTVSEVMDGHVENEPMSLSQIRPDLPVALTSWVHWLMHKKPDQRPADAVNAYTVLRQIVSGEITDLNTHLLRLRAPLNSQNQQNIPRRITTTAIIPAQNIPSTAADAFTDTPSLTRLSSSRSSSSAPASSTPKKNLSVAIAISSALLAAGGGFLFFNQKKSQAAMSTNTVAEALTNKSSTPATSKKLKSSFYKENEINEYGHVLAKDQILPTESHLMHGDLWANLVVFLTAKKDMYAHGGAVAKSHEPTSFWIDIAPDGGRNGAEWEQELPQINIPEKSPHAVLNAGVGGFLRPHPVVHFHGNSSLNIMRDDFQKTGSLKDVLDQGDLTIYCIYRNNNPDKRQVLLSSHVDFVVGRWEIQLQPGNTITLSASDGQQNSSEVSLSDTQPDSFKILAASFNQTEQTMSAYVRYPDQSSNQPKTRRAYYPSVKGAINEIGIGARPVFLDKYGKRHSPDYTQSDIALILIYNRAHDEERMTHLTDLIRQLYFEEKELQLD
jgi:serine/threonine protein kinase